MPVLLLLAALLGLFGFLLFGFGALPVLAAVLLVITVAALLAGKTGRVATTGRPAAALEPLRVEITLSNEPSWRSFEFCTT